MKNEIRLALLCLAATAVPAFAQNALPQCGSANFDPTRNMFTVMNPAAGAVNQQCLVTVHPRGAVPDQSRQYPAPYLVEGRYIIELSGAGGGGGGGGPGDQKSGAGGASGQSGNSAATSRTVQYLSPGVYKLTIGTGGEGGRAQGGRSEDGNPTSLTNANTGQLIAGFAGADVWRQGYAATASGRGDVATSRNTAALAGGEGGHGFVRLTMSEPAQAIAPAPQLVARTPVYESAAASATTPAPAATRPARRDRN